MRLTRLFVVAGIAGVLLTTACSSTRPVRDQASDAAITSKITAKIAADPEVNPFNIDVDTTDGEVVLRGKVEKPAAKAEAEKHARSTKGVVSVRNAIVVVGHDESDDGYFSDAAIATKVKSKITADPELNPFNIDVDVQDRVVLLTGAVRSQAAKDEAEKLALATKGVERVDNQLEVKPKDGGS